jgi:cytidylate kinase
MAIVTISRQLGSLGTEISRRLKKEMKWNYLDKESLEELFASYGLPQESVHKYDEKRPSFWENFSSEKDRYLHFMTKAVYDVASKGNCIILGRGGQVILTDLPGALHVRVTASIEVRVKRIMERYRVDERHAEKMVHQSDHDRAGFHKFFFDVNWESCSLYDLVINTHYLSVDASLKVIQSLLKTDEMKKRSQEAEKMLTDLCLGHEVATVITYKEHIPIHFLEAAADSGLVTLRGSAMSKDDINRSEAAARKIAGVTGVINEIQFVPITFGMA